MTDDLSKQLADMRDRYGANSTIGHICRNLIEIRKSLSRVTDAWARSNLKRSMHDQAEYLKKLVSGR